MKRLLAAIGLVAVSALPAGAQQLHLEIRDGRVTLDATNASARQILAEWARIGGTNVVGADKITGTPLTLKLVDMPEQQALDIILRNVAGFMAAPRRAGVAGASAYDRILIMATSVNAAQASNNVGSGNSRAPGLGNSNPMNGTQRFVPRPPNLPPSPANDNADPDDQAEPDADTPQPVFTFPSPNQIPAPGGGPVFVPLQNGPNGGVRIGPGPGGVQQVSPAQGGPQQVFPGGNQQVPTINLQPGPNGPTIYNFVPNAPTTPGVATTPFGAVGAPTPGMIQQPAPAPGQPVPNTRPPR
jgi:hypothetical protein